MESIHPATLILIVITAIISYKGFKDDYFFERYKFNVGAVQKKQWERLLTSAFLHVDVSHLLFNMLTFYFFADIVIYRLGVFGFLGTYLISLLAGNLLSLFYYRKQSYYSAVGASGAVTGILYAAIILFPEMQLGIFFIPIPLPAYVVGLGYMLYTLYGIKKANDFIGHMAHFGGAISGFIIALLLYPIAVFSHPIAVIALLLPLLIFVVMEVKSN